MERTDKVRIIGPGTDLRFSIKGIPAIPCAGNVIFLMERSSRPQLKKALKEPLHIILQALIKGLYIKMLV